jgi:hypothetical protein
VNKQKRRGTPPRQKRASAGQGRTYDVRHFRGLGQWVGEYITLEGRDPPTASLPHLSHPPPPTMAHRRRAPRHAPPRKDDPPPTPPQQRPPPPTTPRIRPAVSVPASPATAVPRRPPVPPASFAHVRRIRARPPTRAGPTRVGGPTRRRRSTLSVSPPVHSHFSRAHAPPTRHSLPAEMLRAKDYPTPRRELVRRSTTAPRERDARVAHARSARSLSLPTSRRGAARRAPHRSTDDAPRRQVAPTGEMATAFARTAPCCTRLPHREQRRRGARHVRQGGAPWLADLRTGSSPPPCRAPSGWRRRAPPGAR